MDAQGTGGIGRVVREAAKRPFEFGVGVGPLVLGAQGELGSMVTACALNSGQEAMPLSLAGVAPKVQPASQVSTTVNGHVNWNRRFHRIVRGKLQLKTVVSGLFRADK